jgi:pimeloyl-ACP methyl ester carboxylesterase
MHQKIETLATISPEWHESLFGVEIALLLASPVYYGGGVPKGDGSPVVLIPGFLHGDMYLLGMYAWLKRLGYRPYYSGIGFNASCPNLLISDIVVPIVKRAAAQTGRKVHIIGHSLGGVLARSIAVQRSEVASVITLGSPVRTVTVRKGIFQDAEIVRKYLIAHHAQRVRKQCLTAECPCPFMKSLRRSLPNSIPLTAIYTRQDGLISWTSCRTGDPQIDVEVTGTHTGLAFNPAVYRTIAERLAGVRTSLRRSATA